MSEPFQFYQNEAQNHASSTPYLAQLHKMGLDSFERLKFPERHHENWKYTHVAPFLKFKFKKKHSEAPDSIPPVKEGIFCVNGKIKGNLSSLPNGVIISSLRDGLTTYPEKIQPYLNQIVPIQHGFHALNLALFDLGLFIYIPNDVQLNSPIILSHIGHEHEAAYYYRYFYFCWKK